MKLTKFAIGLVAANLAVSCGPRKPKVDTQHNEPLTLPQAESAEQALRLDGASEKKYEGMLVLINPNANPAGIAKVMTDVEAVQVLEAKHKEQQLRYTTLCKKQDALRELAYKTADEAESSKLLDEADTLDDEISVAEKQRGEFFQTWGLAKMAAAKPVYNDNLGLLLWKELRLKLSFEGNLVRVNFRLDAIEKTAPAEGCFDTVKRVSVACPALKTDSKDETVFELTVVDYNPANGQLNIDFNYDEETLTKFGLKYFDDDFNNKLKFQHLEAKELAGKTISLKLTPEKFKGVFSSYAGSIEVWHNKIAEKLAYKGSVGFSEILPN